MYTVVLNVYVYTIYSLVGAIVGNSPYLKRQKLFNFVNQKEFIISSNVLTLHLNLIYMNSKRYNYVRINCISLSTHNTGNCIPVSMMKEMLSWLESLTWMLVYQHSIQKQGTL